MKPIKDYFKNKDLRVEYLDGYAVHINRELLLEIIKEIQIDTIKETVQACADNAYCDLIHPPDDEYPELEESEYKVVKSSILSVADKLIKELE